MVSASVLILACTLPLYGVSGVAVPTQQQLTFQDYEMGCFFQYNIGLYGTPHNNYACSSHVEPASSFTPKGPIDTDSWAKSCAQGLGGKYAVLTTQAGCGFLLWPTKTQISIAGKPSRLFNYTVRESPYGKYGDIVAQFVASCKKYGIRPGLYYNVNSNKLCNVKGGQVANNSGECGNQTEYDQMAFDQMTELWGNYGAVAELWFDGGYPTEMKAKLTALIAKEQPDAVSFQGPTEKNAIRWVGSESGATMEDDNWSTAKNSITSGAGDPDAPVWAPAECDVTMQRTGMWYWNNGTLRTLPELVQLHEHCVGHNGNLLLGGHPDYTGALPQAQIDRMAEFGSWLRTCYGGKPLAQAAPADLVSMAPGSSVSLKLPARPSSMEDMILRVVIAENQTLGQAVRNFTVEALLPGAGAGAGTWELITKGSSIGHKRTIRLSASATKLATVVRVNVTGVAPFAKAAQLRSIAVFNCASESVGPATKCDTNAGLALMGVTIEPTPGPVVNATVDTCCAGCIRTPHCVAFNFRGVGSCELLSTEGSSRGEPATTSGSPAANMRVASAESVLI